MSRSSVAKLDLCGCGHCPSCRNRQRWERERQGNLCESTREAIDAIDAACPWLRGAEVRIREEQHG